MDNQTPDFVPVNEFRFDDSRQVVIYDFLKRLVGDGAASFYKDACRLMAAKPPFETVTHVVAHLLRETESALRDVLESIAVPAGSNEEEGHKNKIRVILKALEISEEGPLAKAWLLLPGKNGLQRMTHRNNLDAARPIDDSFQELWETVNSILFLILERFEGSYIKVFEVLDDLAVKTTPGSNDIKKLKLHIPNNRVAHEYFFNKDLSSAWLSLLESEGFFQTPPQIEHEAEGSGVRHPTWPIFIYLKKMATILPDLVTKILSEIPDSENGSVKAGAIEVVTLLPKQNKLQLIEKVSHWMKGGNQFFSSMKSIDLIKTLTVENEIGAALVLSKDLLEFVPEESSEIPETGYIPSREPKTFIDRWHYSRFLSDNFPSIAEKDPLNSLRLIIALLAKHCEISHPKRVEDPYEDYSYISRPAVETSDHMHRDDVDDSLIATILNVTVDAIEANNNFLSISIQEFKNEPWPIFKRITLYLLSKYPTTLPDITKEYLLNTEFVGDSDFDHEYTLLVDAAFDSLNVDQQKEIYEFIAQAQSMKDLAEKHNYDQKSSDQRIKIWQRNTLSIFENYFDIEQKAKYDKLVQDLGQAENPRTRSNSNGLFVGPISDVNAEKLLEMSPEELRVTLENWQPKKEEPFGFGPSKEGLGRELAIAVRKDPTRFSSMAEQMKGLDPTYVRNFLQPYSEIVQNKIAFEWPAIIGLCLWVIDQPRDISAEEKADPFDQDPDWGWTRRAAISLISHGMNSNVIPYELKDAIWHIIEVLTEDPNPTPEQELTNEGSLSEDAYGLTINSVRGEAMTAVVEYGLWMSRLFAKLPKEDQLERTFNLFPSMQDILEKHLSTDPSIAVRAAYGRYFPWILYLDRKWTIDHLKEIFPEGGFNTPLYDAAWETYVSHVQAYDDVFEVLQEQYSDAVSNIGTEKRKNRLDRDDRLAEHLMIFLWHGKLDMLEDGLIAKFWETANEETRLHAIDFLGRNLQSLDHPLEEAQAKMLKELWESRIAKAEGASDKGKYEKEMGAFGWWFASGKLNEEWSITQFLRVLDITKKVNADYFVVDRLVALADTKPLEAVKILGKLAQGDRQQWVLFGNENDLKEIFTKALRSSDTETKRLAKELINRLVAWGYGAYSNLLNIPPELIEK
jgi:hypothetical protein